MPLVNFPQLLTDFLNENPDTPAIEALAAQLMQSNFPDHSMDDFVTRVCGWGGKQGIRILSRVLKHNTDAEIADALRGASSNLAKGQFLDALTQVDKLRFLDVSFASKFLRFLLPDICPVFDSYLHDALPYTLDASGYSDFANDCAWLANQLVANKFPIRGNAHAERGSWQTWKVLFTCWRLAKSFVLPRLWPLSGID